jgi:hemolysin III
MGTAHQRPDADVSFFAALALPGLWIRGGVGPAVLCLTSGASYIFGAQWFSRTWPRLRQAVFSYPEVWHSLTVAAAAAHFVAVWWIAT